MSDLVSNPFSTRFVAPGKLDWIGPEEFFVRLNARWEAANFRGAILGPHGSGKSTLLEHFVPTICGSIWRRDALGNVTELEATARNRADIVRVVWLQLRKSVTESLRVPWDRLSSGDLLVLDGYEQLSWLQRGTVLRRTWRSGVRLLVTSHRKTALKTVCELSVDEVLARQVVERLLSQGGEPTKIGLANLGQRLQNHQGNLRDVLMDLYDEVEQRNLDPN